MKFALICAVLAALATVGYCQDLPTLPPGWEESVHACVAFGVANIVTENAEQAHAVAVWTIELTRTVNDLLQERRRCEAMTNDRLQQICMASWSASVLIEANRLRRDLQSITTEAVADEFYYHILSCFGVDPDYVPPVIPEE